MSILITGGKGQVGRELAQLLSNTRIPFAAPGRTELDVTDCDALEAALGGVAGAPPVSTVIHAAAFTGVDLCEASEEQAFEVNAVATERLASLCAERGIRMVHISTDFIFDGAKNTPYEVEDLPNPLNTYGASKLAAEEAVRRLVPESYIVRTSWVFGVHGANFPRVILKAAAAGGPLRVVSDQVGRPTYARDLAEGILVLMGTKVPEEGIRRGPLASTPAPVGTYHVCSSDFCSWFEFAQEIVRQAGWRIPVEPISSNELARPAQRPLYSVLSLKTIEARGLTPRSWQEALSVFLEQLRPLAPELFPNGGI